MKSSGKDEMLNRQILQDIEGTNTQTQNTQSETNRWTIVHLEELLLLPDVILLKSGHSGCDRMVGALTSANAMSSYHH